MTGDRVRAVATCEHCGWSAEHTGDDGLEVATFLRSALIAHVDTLHPEHGHPADVARVEREGDAHIHRFGLRIRR